MRSTSEALLPLFPVLAGCPPTKNSQVDPRLAGPPESGAVQEILHWQANTVGMMYSLIADAIKAKGT